MAARPQLKCSWQRLICASHAVLNTCSTALLRVSGAWQPSHALNYQASGVRESCNTLCRAVRSVLSRGTHTHFMTQCQEVLCSFGPCKISVTFVEGVQSTLYFAALPTQSQLPTNMHDQILLQTIPVKQSNTDPVLELRSLAPDGCSLIPHITLVPFRRTQLIQICLGCLRTLALPHQACSIRVHPGAESATSVVTTEVESAPPSATLQRKHY